MSQIIDGKFVRSELAKNSNGGTELMAERITKLVPQELLKECQIVVGRQLEPLQEDKIRLYWSHDLPGDPYCDEVFRNKHLYHKFIFVSNWQMQKFIDHYGLEWDDCLVIQNGIEPLPMDYLKRDPKGPVKLGYWSTPHRGLQLLVPVFEELKKKRDVELHIYSGFGLYGWESRDEEYSQLFKHCQDSDKIFVHGVKTNDEIREALKDLEILAYPSIWPETSCLVLMEAMSAGLQCVHSNLAALYETSANWTHMYQFHKDPKKHCHVFYSMLDLAVERCRDEDQKNRVAIAKSYADAFYNIESKAREWTALITSLKDVDRTFQEEMFTFRT